MTDNLVAMARLAQRDERMSTGALYGDLADRIEELEAELLKAIKMIEREIRRVQKIQRDLPPPHKVGLMSVEEEYTLMLAELKGDRP